MPAIIKEKAFNFDLPKLLECAIPSELRGIPRDGVRLLVSHRKDNRIYHDYFYNVSNYLRKGDVLIVNTSGTMNAALPMILPTGEQGRVHFSTRLADKEWLVEVRKVKGNKTVRYHGLKSSKLYLPGDAQIQFIEPYFRNTSRRDHLQLWKVKLYLPTDETIYFEHFGIPIQYTALQNKYPASYYQTVFANKVGSSEMPSAGRAFTSELLERLAFKGVQFAPVLLHTGVSSLEVDERPYPEYFEVSKSTADLINQATENGRRIIAVGTTAIRAIESAIDDTGKVRAQSGMTNLFITPRRKLKVVNSMLTGFHEPKASHLLMMQALADQSHLKVAYESAIQNSYEWHEFGDLHLIL